MESDVPYAPGRLTSFLAAAFLLIAGPAFAAPTGVVPVSESTGSITWQWNSGGVVQYQVALSSVSNTPAGSSYLIADGTTPLSTITTSYANGGLEYSTASIKANTTYYFQVQFLGDTVWSAVASTMTYPAPPGLPPGGAAAFVGASLSTGGFTVYWSSGSGSAGYNSTMTVYALQVSTNPDFRAPVSTGTSTFYDAATGLVFGSTTTLSLNTTYYAQVQARGGGGLSSGTSNGIVANWTYLGSTSTLSMPPAAAASSFASVLITSFTAFWGVNSNPISRTTYTLQISTDGTNFGGSAPYTVGVATLASGASPQYGFAGLVANTVYFFRAQALNNAGAATVWVGLGSTSTLASPPDTVATTFTAVGTNGFAVNWSRNSNPASVTNYTVQISTDGVNFGGAPPYGVSAATAPAGPSPQYTFAGLVPNTVYFFRVQAVNNGGTATAWASLGSVCTLSSAPVSIAWNATYVLATSVSPHWDANGNPSSTTFIAQISADNFGTILASSQTLNPYATFSGLTPNTTYYHQVQSVNLRGVPSAVVPLPTMPTRATPASSPTFPSVGTSSVTAAWLANGNPPGTAYLAQVSTDSFATVNASSYTLNTSAVFPGLAGNATYFFWVDAQSFNGLHPSFSFPTSTTTLPAPPTAAYSSVTVGYVSVGWLANGNGPGTLYVAQISTDAFGTVNASSLTAGSSTTFQGLAASTTYYVRVQSEGFTGLVSTFSVLGATATLAQVPGNPVPSAVGASSISVIWNTSGNPAGTLFIAQVSTDAFSTVNASSRTLNAAAAFLGLLANTSYYFRVQAVNCGGTATGVSPVLTAATALAAPVSAAPSGVAVGSITANWGANGNGPQTLYIAQISADNFSSPGVSSQTFNTSAVFGGLAPNTTYWFLVQAEGFNGTLSDFAILPATPTLVQPPIAPALAAVNRSSISVSWSANGNPAGTVFAAQVSTDGFATINASSRTLNASASFIGLLSNVTYYLRVEAVNYAGLESAFAVLPVTATPVAPPVSAPPPGVGDGSVTANWGSGGNGPLTLFLAQISTDAFATVNASSLTYNSSATFSGLAAGTNYDFRVAAIGFSGASTPFVALPSTSTTGSPPALAATTYLSVAASSIAVQWTGGRNLPGTLYVAQISTDGFATVNLSSSTFNLFAAFGTGGAGPALTPNTTYSFLVQAWSVRLLGSLPLGSTSTLANPPLAPAVTPVGVSSIGLTWSANGDPSGTIYVVDLSTDAFATVNVSSRTLNASAAFFSLVPNATYFLRAQAVNNNAVPTAFAIAPASATLPATPVSAAVLSVTTGAAALAWGANGNAAGTLYLAQISTDNFGTVNQTSATLGVSAAFDGLAPNTTYFCQVRAQGFSGTLTAPASFGSTVTLANAPSTAALSVYLSSIALTWSGAGNPARTLYAAQLSTDAFATLNASSATLNTSATFFALLSNATYWLRVQAIDNLGRSTAFSILPATATSVATPTAGPAPSAGPTTATTVWGANGNGPATLYVAQISTDSGFATINASSLTYNSSATFAGLAADTTYYFQVAAQGFSMVTPFVTLASTMTPLQPPGTASPAFPSVGYSSATIQWTSGGNGAAAIYEAQLSTDAFASVNLTSATANLSAVFGAGGAGPALTANTTYYLRVRAARGTNASAFLLIGSTATLAFAPSATALVGVSSSAVGLSWSANGNPQPGTRYEVWQDVSAAFTAPVKTAVAAVSYVASGLVSSTTYFFQVRTVGNGGAYTAFDAGVSTATLPSPPGQPGVPAATVLGVSSISWTWSAVVFASSYTLRQSSSPATVVGGTVAPPLTVTGLSTNTAYGVVVGAVNISGPGPLSPPATAYTLAMPPTGTAASQIQTTSATLSWSFNTNPAATTASVERSTDNAVFASVLASAVTTYVDTGLLSCTTYYYRVRNFNGDSVPTAYDATVQFTTLISTPLPPSGLAAQPLPGNRIALAWSPSPSPQISSYRLYTDSGTGPVNHLTAVLPSTSTSYATGVLASSGAYTFLLRAFNACGVEEPNNSVLATAASTAAISAVSAAIALPASGAKIAGDRVTVSASLFSGSVSGLSQIIFQFRAAGTTYWTNIPAADPGHPNPAPAAPYLVHWNVSLTAGGYDLRAVAVSRSGQADGAAPVVSVVVDNVNFDVSETDLGGGRIKKQQKVYTGVANTVAVSDGGSGMTANVVLPAGAVTTDGGLVTVVCNPTGLAPPPSGSLSVGLSLQVDLPGGQGFLAGGQTAPVAFNYQDNNGFVAGTNVRADLLRIFVYNTATGKWEQQFSSAVDPINHVLTGSTPHFSAFQVLALAGADLNVVRVYPNPFEPNSGDSNRGKPFAAGDPSSGIIFDTLPVGAAIDIYTIAGRRVAHLSGGTTIQWDARTDGGRDAASGGYLAVISSPGLPSVVKKILIVR